MSKRFALAHEQRVEDERRGCEVIAPVDLPGNLELLRIVAVDLDQDFHAKGASLGGERGDEAKGLGNHETTCCPLFNRVTHGVEPNHAYAGGLKAPKNCV